MFKSLIEKMIGSYSEREVKKVKPLLEATLKLEDEFSNLTDEELKAKTPYFKDLKKTEKPLTIYFPKLLQQSGRHLTECLVLSTTLFRLLVVLFFIREELQK